MSLCGSAHAVTLDVLWYTYAQSTSEYVSFYSSLSGSGAGTASTYPQSAGHTWNVSFFGPTDPAPVFADYDVLVIHGGEAFRTGTPLATPNYAGILSNKTAIEAARGTRTFISGSDADFHAVRGDSGTCPALNCGAFDGARGYVINAVNWAASGPGLGIVSFYHGEFAGSYWWNDPNSFLRSELEGKWAGSRDNAPIIPASALGYEVNQGLTSTGLSNWSISFHGLFSNIPGYVSTVDSGFGGGNSVSIATIELCQPGGNRYCISATVNEPASTLLLGGSIVLLFVVSRQTRRPTQSARIPAALITFPIRFTSAFTNAESSSAELPTVSMPAAANFSLTSARMSTRTIS
jgi:hypothetical protein